jgi:catechol 2,3-dioxygenase-like lactoylglutathione lyase family enzyme
MKTWLLAAALLAAPLVVRQAQAAPDGGEEPAHFHHVRLNVTDPARSIKFYTRNLGALEIKYRGRVPALFTERSFLLFNKVDEAPPYLPHSAVSHIGWGSVDGQADYEWLKSQGVEFETPIGKLGNNYGMYFYGPDKELVELWTGGKNHRFNHVHLWATDVAATADWYKKHLGVTGQVLPKPKTQDREDIRSLWMAFLQCDNVGIVVFGRPDFDSRWWPGGSYTKADAPEEFQTTRGRAIDHLAFSYRHIEPVLKRMKAAGVEIVEPIAERDLGHKSFFIMAPDRVLIEIVEARPIPESSWE